MKRFLVLVMLCLAVALSAPSSPNLRLLEVAKEFKFLAGETALLSPTGQLAATWGYERIILWDTATGQFIRDYSYPESENTSVQSFIFSDDSTLHFLINQTTYKNDEFASQKYTRVTIPRLGKITSQVIQERNQAFDLQQFADFDLLLEEPEQQQVRFLPRSGKSITIKHAKPNTNCLEVSKNKKVLLCRVESYGNSQFLTYNLETGRVLQTIKEVFGTPDDVALSPSGQRVAFAFGALARVSIWQDGKKSKVLRFSEAQNSQIIKFSNENQLQLNFAQVNFKSLRMQFWTIDTSTLEKEEFLPLGKIARNITWSEDLKSALFKTEYRTWSYVQQERLSKNLDTFETVRWSLSPDSQRIAFLSTNADVRIFEVKSGLELNRFSLESTQQGLYWFEFVNNNRLLISNNQIWDTNTGKMVQQNQYIGSYLNTNKGVLRLHTENNQLWLLPTEELKTEDNSDTRDQELARGREIGQVSSTADCSWLFNPNGENALCNHNQTPNYQLFRFSDGKEVWNKKLPYECQLQFSPDGRYLSCFDNRKVLRLIETKTGMVRKTLVLNKFELSDFKALSPNNRFALFYNTLFDLETLRVLAVPPEIQGELQFDKTGRYLVESQYSQNAVRLWALPNRSVVF